MPDPNGRLAASADISERRSGSGARGLWNRGALTFFRARDAADRGVGSRALRRLVDDGSVECLARGLHRVADAELTERHTRAAVCARVPSAVLCLLTALSVHELGTQLPHQVWIAIPHKARTPRVSGLPIRVVRFSGAALRPVRPEGDRRPNLPRRRRVPREVARCSVLEALSG